MPAASSGTVYGDGPSASHPSTVAPARASRSAAPAAPEPAMPMTWMRSPAIATRSGLGRDAGREVQGREGRRPLVAIAVVAPDVTLDDRRAVPDCGRDVGEPHR